MKGYILYFLKKGDFGITKNCRGLTFTTIADKVYNALLLNCIKLYKNLKAKVCLTDKDTNFNIIP